MLVDSKLSTMKRHCRGFFRSKKFFQTSRFDQRDSAWLSGFAVSGFPLWSLVHPLHQRVAASLESALCHALVVKSFVVSGGLCIFTKIFLLCEVGPMWRSLKISFPCFKNIYKTSLQDPIQIDVDCQAVNIQ